MVAHFCLTPTAKYNQAGVIFPDKVAPRLALPSPFHTSTVATQIPEVRLILAEAVIRSKNK